MSPAQLNVLTAALVNVNNGRNGRDANSLLGSIHTFDATLGCDAATFQPCSDRALSNHKSTVDSFRYYNLNKGIPEGQAIAIGRYSEDVYYGGNPWYLSTLAAAELLYDALYVWRHQSSVSVTDVSKDFFNDLVPGITTGSYAAGSPTYQNIVAAVSNYADGFVNVVAKYTPAGGALSEQFTKDNGTSISARDLTWSYASLLTAAARRKGLVPEPWSNTQAASVPPVCSATSVIGTYKTATATSFPPNQTPITGAPPTKTTTVASTTTSTGCATASVVAVTFRERVVTQFGQTIKIVGNNDLIGNWDPKNAIALDASDYTANDPIWKVTITFPAGTSIQYKYINFNQDGTYTWEKDPNHNYTVPKTCASTVTQSDTWQA